MEQETDGRKNDQCWDSIQGTVFFQIGTVVSGVFIVSTICKHRGIDWSAKQKLIPGRRTSYLVNRKRLIVSAAAGLHEIPKDHQHLMRASDSHA